MTTYTVIGRRGEGLPQRELGSPTATPETAEMLRDLYAERGWLDVSIVESTTGSQSLGLLECFDDAHHLLRLIQHMTFDLGFDTRHVTSAADSLGRLRAATGLPDTIATHSQFGPAHRRLPVAINHNLLVSAHQWIWWFGGMERPASVWTSGEGLHVATGDGAVIISSEQGRGPIVCDREGSSHVLLDYLMHALAGSDVSPVDLAANVCTGISAIRLAWDNAAASALSAIANYRTSA